MFVFKPSLHKIPNQEQIKRNISQYNTNLSIIKLTKTLIKQCYTLLSTTNISITAIQIEIQDEIAKLEMASDFEMRIQQLKNTQEALIRYDATREYNDLSKIHNIDLALLLLNEYMYVIEKEKSIHYSVLSYSQALEEQYTIQIKVIGGILDIHIMINRVCSNLIPMSLDNMKIHDIEMIIFQHEQQLIAQKNMAILLLEQLKDIEIQQKFYDFISRYNHTTDIYCPICLDLFAIDYNDKNKKFRTILLTDCCHQAFHLECIDLWRIQKETCSICRQPCTTSLHKLFSSKNEMFAKYTMISYNIDTSAACILDSVANDPLDIDDIYYATRLDILHELEKYVQKLISFIPKLQSEIPKRQIETYFVDSLNKSLKTPIQWLMSIPANRRTSLVLPDNSYLFLCMNEKIYQIFIYNDKKSYKLYNLEINTFEDICHHICKEHSDLIHEFYICSSITTQWHLIQFECTQKSRWLFKYKITSNPVYPIDEIKQTNTVVRPFQICTTIMDS